MFLTCKYCDIKCLLSWCKHSNLECCWHWHFDDHPLRYWLRPILLLTKERGPITVCAYGCIPSHIHCVSLLFSYINPPILFFHDFVTEEGGNKFLHSVGDFIFKHDVICRSPCSECELSWKLKVAWNMLHILVPESHINYAYLWLYHIMKIGSQVSPHLAPWQNGRAGGNLLGCRYSYSGQNMSKTIDIWLVLWNLIFLQQWILQLHSSGMWHLIVWLMVTNILKESWGQKWKS